MTVTAMASRANSIDHASGACVFEPSCSPPWHCAGCWPAGGCACGCSRGEGAGSPLRHHRTCTVRCRLGHPVTVRGQPVTVPEQRRAAGYAAWERRAERPMLVLALVFLVVLVVPMVADLPPAGRTAFTVADVAIWAAFAVDYVARLYLAPARWRFVRSHLLDLLVLVVPFLRPLRALRPLRIARLGAVAGVAHSRAQRSLHATVAVYVTTAAAGLLVLAAAAMYDVERRAPSGNIKTFPDAPAR